MRPDDATAADGRAARSSLTAFRGAVLHCLDDPGDALEPDGTVALIDDGALVVEQGRVHAVGDAQTLLQALPPSTSIVDYRGRLIVPGFVDAHVHYAQTDIISSFGTELLGWLERYAFPAEQAFAVRAHADEVAAFFIDELLANGTTSACVFATVHPQSADAIFTAAQRKRMRLLAGKIMMDRNAPDGLRDTAVTSYEESKRLIEQWHGKDRLGYAITPRFTGSSTEAQLAFAARLYDEHPNVALQSHLAENRAEVAWMRELFPACRSYLDIYEKFGLVRPRSVYAHSIHIDDTDRARMAQGGAAAVFCPTSNLFLGSGLFDLRAADEHGMRVGIGTDVGGGTSFSMLRTLAEGYKVLKLNGQTLTPWRAIYLATLGGARALGLDQAIGNFAPGKEADFVVLDPCATRLLERRTARATSWLERLFALIMLGDDRATAATYVLGEPVYERRTLE